MKKLMKDGHMRNSASNIADETTWYTVADIERMENNIPPLRTAHMIKTQIKSGKLNAIITGEGVAKSYAISRKELKRFKKEWENQG